MDFWIYGHPKWKKLFGGGGGVEGRMWRMDKHGPLNVRIMTPCKTLGPFFGFSKAQAQITSSIQSAYQGCCDVAKPQDIPMRVRVR